ncbi:exonuclease [Bacillus phage Shbh1]|uniref:Putative exonuclease subunit 2-like protein n=1 Tax=Bacillus phage Shbh1 TaxID=1796992 RepID=A0A142F1G9_9CAUD|nr:exonuclease [Bacillus phage Shbh1]AMQ66626.1 putative exonuclease subunit 2-like protein [Bacillus phage Shbh1]
MRWTRVHIQNFLSIENVTLDLDNQGLILIEGKNKTNSSFESNGSGKSSLLDSIIYALYDTTSKGIKADDVVNRVHKKNTSVILEGVKGGDTYRIERYRKHSKHKNTVKLFINEKEVTEKSTKDTNAAIERIVGIDYNTFINSIMFSQGNGAGRFAKSTDKEKKEILENLVNLNIYAVAQDVAKDRLKDKQNEIDQVNQTIDKLKWQLDSVHKQEVEDQNNYAQVKALLKEESDNLIKINEEFQEFNNTTLEESNKLRIEIKELQEKQSTFNQVDITGISNQVNSLYVQIQQKSNEQANLIKTKDDLVNNYKKLQVDANCPVCGNLLDQDHKERELQSIKEELGKVLVSLKTIESEISNLNAQYREIHNEYLKQKELYDNLSDKYKEITDLIHQKQQQLDRYAYRADTYSNQIQNKNNTIVKLRQVPKPKSREEERNQINGQIEECKNKILQLEREKSNLENVVKVYSNSGVKSHVLDLITPFLNEQANKYLSKLSGSDIEITFSTQKRNKNGELTDKFDVQVHNLKGGESYQANSEGEKKRIDLAISLAIQDLVMSKAELSTNFIVYDEVFDALDSVGSENVVTLLKERLEKVGTIFVITHNNHLFNLFEKVITVVRDKDGISKIEEGESAP